MILGKVNQLSAAKEELVVDFNQEYDIAGANLFAKVQIGEAFTDGRTIS
jgi:hypothetical protein